MLLLCWHSGLRISDAVCLERSKLLPNDALFLRTTKTALHSRLQVRLCSHFRRAAIEQAA